MGVGTRRPRQKRGHLRLQNRSPLTRPPGRRAAPTQHHNRALRFGRKTRSLAARAGLGGDPGPSHRRGPREAGGAPPGLQAPGEGRRLCYRLTVSSPGTGLWSPFRARSRPELGGQRGRTPPAPHSAAARRGGHRGCGAGQAVLSPAAPRPSPSPGRRAGRLVPAGMTWRRGARAGSDGRARGQGGLGGRLRPTFPRRLAPTPPSKRPRLPHPGRRRPVPAQPQPSRLESPSGAHSSSLRPQGRSAMRLSAQVIR